MGKLLDMIKMFVILIVVMVSQVYTYVKIHQIVHFKYTLFIVHQLCLIRLFKKKKKRMQCY